MQAFATPAGQLELEVIEPDELPTQRSPSILFLHEGLGSIAGWRGLPRRITKSTGLRSVTYSRLGYGQSDPLASDEMAPDFLDREASTTLPALIQHLELDRPVLVGHSDGASIALRYAMNRPWDVLGLVLIAPHTFVEDVTVEGIQAAVRRFRSHATDRPNRLRTSLERQHGEKTQRTFKAWSSVWLSDAFKSWDLRPLLHRLRCPTLLIQGTLDAYGTPRQIDSIVDNSPGRTEVLWLRGSGHAPHLERPDETADRIVQFVRKLVDARSQNAYRDREAR